MTQVLVNAMMLSAAAVVVTACLYLSWPMLRSVSSISTQTRKTHNSPLPFGAAVLVLPFGFAVLTTETTSLSSVVCTSQSPGFTLLHSSSTFSTHLSVSPSICTSIIPSHSLLGGVALTNTTNPRFLPPCTTFAKSLTSRFSPCTLREVPMIRSRSGRRETSYAVNWPISSPSGCGSSYSTIDGRSLPTDVALADLLIRDSPAKKRLICNLNICTYIVSNRQDNLAPRLP